MVTQTDALTDLVKRKVVTADEAYLKAVDKEALVKKLEAEGIRVKRY